MSTATRVPVTAEVTCFGDEPGPADVHGQNGVGRLLKESFIRFRYGDGYGIQCDRPTSTKYSRAFGLAITAGVVSLVGFFFVVPGGVLVHAAKDVYQWSDTTTFWLNIA